MSFPRYPAYKDSGVEWLGEVPGHWASVPLKTIIDQIESGVSVNAVDTPATADESGVLKTSCVYHGDFDASENKAVVQNEYDRLACPVTANTLIVSRMNTPDLVGAAGLVRLSQPHLFLPDRLWQVHFRDSDPRYVHYWTRTPSYRAQVQVVCAGTSSSMQNLSQEDFRSFLITRPPLSEQSQIAAFLDRETAKIDALVTEQRRLMELLKEKRQAVISHAVTRGLNPEAPMKPSGIEWLGDVPEHWEVLKLKFLCEIQTGDKDTENAVDNGIYPFFVRSQTVERINSMSFDCEAILTAGDGVGVGKVFHYHNGPFDFHQRVYMMNNFKNVSGPYLFHFFRENFYKVALEGGAKSTVDSLRRPMFMNFTVCVPTKAEQAAIVVEIEKTATQFDTLTTEAQHAIDLLQERRTALISAAVTGQIDVRSAV
ncbi:restriction endonuclease subunit S [Rhodoferax fermentans]|uniref:Type I restriction modification DNA specificity domain-containing protein n=1 Tax=Rhodoferax fermentans TaxID=28066 RepID=A0A1T1AWK3_RHOFE|nr:restriction endonuclease subunit S [Rhodoferax fermentans]MBK1684841.1 restriction endonuclease subunit S [Rhodoferax fermentans]OOV08461.1 hypothetical protein RF819_18730 [Rhodoferax fermentans]